MTLRCECHNAVLDPHERAWLKEDDTILCDDGHADEQRDDPFDNFDHGTPYTASVLDKMFARVTRTTVRPIDPTIRRDLAACKETNS